MTPPGSPVGVDVGGTFTDLVAWLPGSGGSAGRLVSCKVPTTPAEPARGVVDGLAAIGSLAGPVASIAHGTTTITNAIVEGRGARVGLVTRARGEDVESGGTRHRGALRNRVEQQRNVGQQALHERIQRRRNGSGPV